MTQKQQNIVSMQSMATEPVTTDDLLAIHPSEVADTLSTEIASFSALDISSLEITGNTTGVRKVYPLDKETVTIGGDRTNDIVIDHLTISDFHLQIIRQDNQWILSSILILTSDKHYMGCFTKARRFGEMKPSTKR